MMALPSEGRGHKFESVGRASKINELGKARLKGPRAKLTINSPRKSACWRVIGGDRISIRSCEVTNRLEWRRPVVAA